MCDVKQENGNFLSKHSSEEKILKKNIVACRGVKKIKEDLSIVEQSSLLYCISRGVRIVALIPKVQKRQKKGHLSLAMSHMSHIRLHMGVHNYTIKEMRNYTSTKNTQVKKYTITKL